MSSDMKDARWGWSYRYAEEMGASQGDFTYEEWEAILDLAQSVLKGASKDVIKYWATEFRAEE